MSNDYPSTESKPLLPEFHYDMVARILPGSCAILVFSSNLKISKITPTQLLIYLAFAYIWTLENPNNPV